MNDDSPTPSIEHLREPYRKLFNAAFKDALAAVEKYQQAKLYVGTHYEFPQLYYNENGIPSLSNTGIGSPRDYKTCFGLNSNEINENNLPSLNQLVDFIRSNTSLLRKIIPTQMSTIDFTSFAYDMNGIYARLELGHAIDAYINQNKSFIYSEEIALKLTDNKINFIFNETLTIDICIPILFLKFTSDKIEVSDNIYIEKITDKLHKARYGNTHIDSHRYVKASATHQLILKNWELQGKPAVDFLASPNQFPLDIIDRFFAVLRAVITFPTGYAQIYALATNWLSYPYADLPSVISTSTRSYPNHFESAYIYGKDDYPVVTKAEIDQVIKYFKSASAAKENSIKLSLNRLNRCCIRDSEEDAVLDATIALEALLSDGTATEMTHKLAMRVAGLVKFDKDVKIKPQQAFKDIKKIYAHRSKIAHGSASFEKSRILKIDGLGEFPTHEITTVYLKFVIRILLAHPEFRDAKKIDESLLLS